MNVVFNELCVDAQRSRPDISLEIATQWLIELADMLQTLYGRYGADIMRTKYGFSQFELFPGYPIGRVLSLENKDIPTGVRRIINRYAQKGQYLQDIQEIAEENGMFEHAGSIIEYRFEGQIVHGLGAAVLLEGLGVSLPTEPCWDTHEVKLNVQRIAEDTIEETEQTVRHIARLAHIENHQPWLNETYGIRSGRVLESRLRALFPHLVFCDNAKRQIRSLNIGLERIQEIIDRLSSLETYCENWADGAGFNIFDLNELTEASNESNPTMQQYGKQRVFRCPDGKSRTFSHHLKDLHDNWRIHFWADEDREFRRPDNRRSIVVGHVGPHLDTASYRS
ncbi:hypothetical protein QUF58_07500 [Anaerolineales bacterium HSG24]|nr:hypothetical protein [Anaerolineales bacterium HSG24]